MGNLAELDTVRKKLYLVNDLHIVLAYSPQDAVELVQITMEDKTDFQVSRIEDDRVLHVIHSGKVQTILWQREPMPLERLAWTMTVREFIDNDLKRQPIPSMQDCLEDRGAIIPKR